MPEQNRTPVEIDWEVKPHPDAPKMRAKYAGEIELTRYTRDYHLEVGSLKGRVIVLSAEDYRGDQAERLFMCRQGFGCSPVTVGTAVNGYFLCDGEECRVERYQIAFVVN